MKKLQYTLDLESVASGYLDVRLDISEIGETSKLTLALPVWTPGSYLVREYAQFLSSLSVVDKKGEKRNAHKQSKSTWEVDCKDISELTVIYRLYGQTLNVRYNHFDNTHAFIHGPATFLYIPNNPKSTISVEIVNTDWEVTTGLRRIGPSTFYADDYDMLIDCPIEVGNNHALDFDVLGKQHRFEFWGEGNYDASQIVRDTKKVIRTAAKIFESKLPYESFAFITHLTEKDYGGLEHRNSTALMVPRNSFRSAPINERSSNEDETYRSFLGLVSHEFFHTWNVKRIKPAAFNNFDYQNENYTRDMWTVEGITSYYDDLILQRAGLISRDVYLQGVAKMIARLEQTPGREICSLEDASIDTWIRLYRPHPTNQNSNISYYLKGALISLILDLKIRLESGGTKSLDDVLAYLWAHHSGDKGYPEGSYESIVQIVGEIESKEFFDKFVRGTVDPDWNSFFKPFGLTLTWKSEEIPYLGIQLDGTKIKSVDDGSPAMGKLHPNDEIIAIDNRRFSGDLSTRLKVHIAKDTLIFSGFRNGMLFNTRIELHACKTGEYTFSINEDADTAAKNRLENWIK